MKGTNLARAEIGQGSRVGGWLVFIGQLKNYADLYLNL